MKKAFDYFEHAADVGIVGRGATVERAFEAAAAAMFALMTRPPRRATERIEFAFVEPDVELALVTWLNRLLAEARAHRLALKSFHVAREPGNVWRGRAGGAPVAKSRDYGTEVKGATLTALAVRADGAGAEARCVVDV